MSDALSTTRVLLLLKLKLMLMLIEVSVVAVALVSARRRQLLPVPTRRALPQPLINRGGRAADAAAVELHQAR